MRFYSPLVALFTAGILLAAAFHGAPRFRDLQWQSRVPFGDSDAYFKAVEQNRTLEGQLREVGIGLAALALSLGVAAAVIGVRGWSTLRSLSTPSRWWAIVLFANLTFVGLLCAEWQGLLADLQHGEYPSWADTPAIPLAGFVFGGIVGVPIITVGILVCLWRARLPAPLWSSPMGWWAWLATFAIAVLLAIEALSLAGAVQVGNAFAIPFHVAALYWLLCGRAAAVSRHAA
jgi:hypothetical protein